MMFDEHRSYRTQEGLIDRLDAWFGPDAALWPFISDVLMPWAGRMSYTMAALMFVAAVLHDDPLFATLLLAIVLLLARLRRSALA